MQTKVLNGYGNSQTTGFNRAVTYTEENMNGFNRASYEMDGFNHASYKIEGFGTCNLNGYELNGYVLSGLLDLEDEEFDAVLYALDQMDGYELGLFGKKAKARRQARRTERQARRSAKQASKQQKRDLKNEMRQARIDKKRARSEKIRSKIGEPGFGDKLMTFGKDVVSAFTGDAPADVMDVIETVTGQDINLPDLSDFGIFQDDPFTDMVESGEAAEKGLFSPPSLFENPGKWFGSKKVPTWKKAAVVGGGVLVLDALTGGNIVLKRAGIMKKSKKRR